MKTTTVVLTLLVAASAGFLLAGCSPTGWATRTVQDGSSLTPGDNVTVILDNGTEVRGSFTGMTTMPPAGYSDYYAAAAMKPRDKNLPTIGQQVNLTTSLSETRVWSGRLIGFDSKSCWFIPDGEGVAQTVYFSSLTSLSGRDGETFQRMELRTMYCDGAIPLMTALSIGSPAGTELVPLSAVRSLNIESPQGLSTSRTIAMDGSTLRMQSFR